VACEDRGHRRRDTATDEALEAAGWRVVRVWEHEDPELAVDRAASVVPDVRRGATALEQA
jgi:DNA mismatch endonuclease (patch repair protein)